jgi:hypothetical protein
MFNKGADNAIIQEVISIMEKMIDKEQDAVLKYVQWYTAELKALWEAATGEDQKKTG